MANYKVHQTIVNNNFKGIKKDYGMFFTPEWVVDFMVNLIDFHKYAGKKDIAIRDKDWDKIKGKFLIPEDPIILEKTEISPVFSIQTIARS